MGGRHAVFASFVLSLAFLSSLFSIVRVAPDVSATELPVLKLTAAPGLAYAPADVTIVVLAKPDERNRHLAIAMAAPDSGYERSSQRSLDGANERGELARAVYKGVPAGNYIVVVATFDREGKLIARRTVDVKRIGRFQP